MGVTCFENGIWEDVRLRALPASLRAAFPVVVALLAAYGDGVVSDGELGVGLLGAGGFAQLVEALMSWGWLKRGASGRLCRAGMLAPVSAAAQRMRERRRSGGGRSAENRTASPKSRTGRMTGGDGAPTHRPPTPNSHTGRMTGGDCGVNAAQPTSRRMGRVRPAEVLPPAPNSHTGRMTGGVCAPTERPPALGSESADSHEKCAVRPPAPNSHTDRMIGGECKATATPVRRQPSADHRGRDWGGNAGGAALCLVAAADGAGAKRENAGRTDCERSENRAIGGVRSDSESDSDSDSKSDSDSGIGSDSESLTDRTKDLTGQTDAMQRNADRALDGPASGDRTRQAGLVGRDGTVVFVPKNAVFERLRAEGYPDAILAEAARRVGAESYWKVKYIRAIVMNLMAERPARPVAAVRPPAPVRRGPAVLVAPECVPMPAEVRDRLAEMGLGIKCDPGSHK